MTRARRLTLLLVTCAVPLAGACASASRKVPPPELPGQALVVLLPDPETGSIGRAIVSNTAGRVELSAARDSTVVRAKTAPTAVAPLTQANVRDLFAEALDALPPPQRHFTLFFRFDSEELTPESRSLTSEILRAVKDRRVPDVLIVGHTDTMGALIRNFELGLRRANTVRNILRETGLDQSLIDVISHGETELLVPTADGVFEARNRRVEITVR
jgi:outer membrane protein OmpA-like peptidoglycan-associated protein